MSNTLQSKKASRYIFKKNLKLDIQQLNFELLTAFSHHL